MARAIWVGAALYLGWLTLKVLATLSGPYRGFGLEQVVGAAAMAMLAAGPAMLCFAAGRRALGVRPAPRRC